MPPHHRHQGPRANSKTPAGKRMPLKNVLNTVGYHDIRKYFYEILILPYFRKFSHSKITTYMVAWFAIVFGINCSGNVGRKQ